MPPVGPPVRTSAPDDAPPRWLDEEERATWLSLMRVMTRLPAALDAQLKRDADLNHFEYTVLAMLSEQADRCLRMSTLASVTNASPSRLSHVAKLLESRGLICRQPDPADGRGTIAVLTEAGEATVLHAAPGHVEAVRQMVFDALPAPLLRRVREANERILGRVDPEGATVPPPITASR